MRIPLISTLALLATAAASSSAAAQEAPTCQVEILRAPPEVQPVIEEWVRAEKVCGPALEVRVIPTAGGLYILAEDANGRVRERVVPDATTAAVLIASWAADDGAARPAAPAAAPPIGPVAPPPVPLAPPAPPASAAPGATAIAMEPPAPPAPPPAPPAPPPAPPLMPPSVVLVDGGSGGRRGSRSLDVGLVFTANDSTNTLSTGVKLGLDLATRHGIRFGLAGSYARTALPFFDYYGYAPETAIVHDVRVTGRAAIESARGRWSGRLELGLGAVVSSVSTMNAGSATGAAPYGEASATLGFRVSPSWRVRGGPVVTVSGQTIRDSNGIALSRGGALEAWAGVDRAF